jgi:hypothetical protein
MYEDEGDAKTVLAPETQGRQQAEATHQILQPHSIRMTPPGLQIG